MTPSHSGFTLLMQEVALHRKFPLQFDTGRHDGKESLAIRIKRDFQIWDMVFITNLILLLNK